MLSPKRSLTPSQKVRYVQSTDFSDDRGNSILPHTRESGDPYYIGDAYDALPWAVSQEWELVDGVKRPYLEHIKRVSSGAWPHLRYLADWMEVTTAPVKWKFIKAKESSIRAERASRVKVAVVDLHPETGVSVRTVTTILELTLALKEPSTPENADRHRLYIVEDLSRDVIELLGRELDLDPLLFREQISDYLWFNTRDPWVELPDLQMVSKQRPVFHLRYMRPRYFETPESFFEALEQAGMFNVLRRVDSDRNHKTAWDEDGACVGLVRSRTSFSWKAAVPGQHGTIGVALIDPTIEAGSPLWSGYRSFQQTPSMSSPGPFQAPPRTSLFDATVHWCQQLLPDQIPAMANDPRTMLIPAAQMICAEWLIVCRYITARLTQIEWELENPGFRRDPNGIDASLSKLHPLRRSVPMYIDMVRETIARLFPTDAVISDGVQALRPDFVAVEKAIEELQERIERIVAVATAIISIEDSRREMNLNLYLGRLSYIAVFFAPLSFISSFFSMNPDLGSLGRTFWIYCCSAVPLTILAALIIERKYVRDLVVKRLGGDRKRKLN